MKSWIPRSNELIKFEKRWKRSQNAEDEMTELDMFGYWWYDTVFALAIALEKVASGINFSTNFKRQPEPMNDLDGIGTSVMGPRLIPLIRNIKLNGLSGDFHLVDGQLQPSMYQIVNILDKGLKHVGYWTPTNGIIKKLHQTKGSKDDLGAIIWPGDTTFSPKGWEIPTSSESKLRVAVPAGRGFVQFVDVNIDPKTKQVTSVTGFCIDFFIAVIDALPYAVKIEFVPFAPSGVTGTAESYKEFFHDFSNGVIKYTTFICVKNLLYYCLYLLMFYP